MATQVTLNSGSVDSAGSLLLKTNGTTTAVTIDTAQNMGLGVTPSAWSINGCFEIGGGYAINAKGNGLFLNSNAYYNAGWKYSTSSYATQFIQENGQHKWLTAASGTAGNAITFTQAMTLDASGNLGVGLTSPASRVDVTSASTGVVKFTSGKSGWLYADSAGIALSDTSDFTKNGLYINNTSNYVAVYTGTAGAERARIDSSGNLLVGTTAKTAAEKFSVYTGSSSTNTAYLWYGQTDDRANVIFRHDRAVGATSAQQCAFLNQTASQVGSINSTGSATSYATSSDYRLKENIAPMIGALAKVAQLKPVTYTWKVDGSVGEGFIAHELQTVVPDAVVGEKDAVDEDGNPVYQGIDTSFLVATLTAAIQELKAEFDAYKASHP